MTPLLIQASRIKAFSVISENLDNKLIEPTIIATQDLDLCNIIGDDLYDAICTQVDAASVSAANTTLLNDYIEPFLINKVIANCVIDLTYKLRNKAIMTTTSDFGQVANLTDLSKVQGQYNNRAEGYKRKMEKFICDNSTDYPLYRNKNKESAIGGLYLGNPRNSYENRYKQPKKDCCD